MNELNVQVKKLKNRTTKGTQGRKKRITFWKQHKLKEIKKGVRSF